MVSEMEAAAASQVTRGRAPLADPVEVLEDPSTSSGNGDALSERGWAQGPGAAKRSSAARNTALSSVPPWPSVSTIVSSLGGHS